MLLLQLLAHLLWKHLLNRRFRLGFRDRAKAGLGSSQSSLIPRRYYALRKLVGVQRKQIRKARLDSDPDPSPIPTGPTPPPTPS